MSRRPAPTTTPTEDDSEAFAASVARGQADAAAGRVAPHAEVRDWLLRWGHGDPGPAPKSRN